MVVKKIIQASVDVIPDYKNNILNVVPYSLSANRFNQATSELANLLSQNETAFSWTELSMVFKISGNLDCDK